MTGTERAKSTGVRATKQRGAIEQVLASVAEFKSAQELHEQLRASGESIGLTTVYRNLQAMADAGAVDTLRTDTGEALFRRCSGEHHHHLVCRECGLTVEVTDRDVETWSAKTAAAHGFTDVTHTLEIFGRCTACARG
ncbi:Fur family transcriptional regulator [Tsukamurella sp. 8F]|uniref:Fur family transcriptional regulator n=1 Tax=unclassified Tsukamurella TaxID=2633480 RepID=UPI0023B916A5|nr:MULTISPECIES: Fur family transcriptional regulator [unclassified Tsukamurella]MDF0529999.1 Fur family transcriptional regulator [Tsukamurella sp. 8J]MDF0587229.1 Fur family transcriptional regulator [Tsukamurella sp. 8F]